MSVTSLSSWSALCRLLCVSMAVTASVAGQDALSIRLRFGMTDEAPRRWDGGVRARNGTVTSVRNLSPHPSESVVAPAGEGTASWKLATRKGLNYPRREYQEENPAGTIPFVYHPAVVIDMQGASNARLTVTTPQGQFSIPAGQMRVGRAEVYLNGAVLVDRVANAEQVSAAEYENDFAAMAADPDGGVWSAWTAYRDKAVTAMARRLRNGKWEEAMAVAGPGDIYRVQLGRDGKGRLWAVWSEQRSGNFDLYAKSFDGRQWSGEERLTQSPQSDVEHVLTTDSAGNLWVAWQGFRDGRADVFARRFDGAVWSVEERVSTSAANDWSPAIAADGAGSVYVAWDTYDKGNYDILMRRWRAGKWEEVAAIANTPRFEAHVRLACDGANRLWAAWNESGFEWGKDTGFLIIKEGTRLYSWRSIQVGVFANGARMDPPDVNVGLPAELREYNDLPVLHKDGAGRMWLFFRHRTLRSPDTPSFTAAHRAAWEIYGTALEGGQWAAPVLLPFSRNRQDVRWGVTNAAGGAIWASWPTDNRDADDYLFRKTEIMAGRIPAYPGTAREPVLRPHVEREVQTYPIHPNEAADTARIRNYTIGSEGKTYRIYRGDTHRHTEFSADGMFDGSLIETYRYAIDAASLDYLGVSDHSNQGGQEVDYINWLLPQIADIFHLPRTFATIFTYERGLSYPNGHRNILTARRGIPALRVPEDEAKGLTGAANLYRYLKQNGAIAISHTSATGMGTDWRDNDPDVEPLVEMYQGDRVSAEYAGAPKTANPDRPQTQQGGYKPKGFIWNAWAKGYKLGVQASSDHLSTHISYACTIAEEFTREGLIAAMKKRHSYAATDNIVLDYRMQTGGREYIQGDAVEDADRVRLWVKVLGTSDVRQIDVIRSNQFIHTVHHPGRDAQFTFEDAEPLAGESYYYVRVQQADDEMAWSSPIWVKRK
ncbi:MAG: hypothetical protein R2762_16045 [Bryobacteraceae bacterium]